MLLTGIHIRMARAALGWSAAETAERSGVSVSTIKRIEAARGFPNVLTSNLQMLQRAFESEGIEFIDAVAPSRGPGIVYTPKDLGDLLGIFG